MKIFSKTSKDTHRIGDSYKIVQKSVRSRLYRMMINDAGLCCLTAKLKKLRKSSTSKYGLGLLQVEQDKEFASCNLSDINDAELQEFLSNLYD